MLRSLYIQNYALIEKLDISFETGFSVITGETGAGFRYDTNKISIIDRKGRTDYPLKSKTEVAQDIIDRLSDELKLLTLNP